MPTPDTGFKLEKGISISSLPPISNLSDTMDFNPRGDALLANPIRQRIEEGIYTAVQNARLTLIKQEIDKYDFILYNGNYNIAFDVKYKDENISDISDSVISFRFLDDDDNEIFSIPITDAGYLAFTTNMYATYFSGRNKNYAGYISLEIDGISIKRYRYITIPKFNALKKTLTELFLSEDELTRLLDDIGQVLLVNLPDRMILEYEGELGRDEKSAKVTSFEPPKSL